jgi:predicted nucleic acid-binding protein
VPDRPAVFCRSTQQSFLRLSTTPALLRIHGADDLTTRDALVALNALMVLPRVCEQEEPPGAVTLWHRFAALDTASPKVWMDGYLAACAITSGLPLVSLDRAFKSYEAHGLDLLQLNP